MFLIGEPTKDATMSATVENLNTYFARAQAKSAGTTFDKEKLEEVALCAEVIQEIYPNARVQGNKVHLGSIRGEHGNSFAINLSNGWWEEHNKSDQSQQKKGRGLISLLQAKNTCSLAEAAQILISIVEKTTDFEIPKKKGAEIVQLISALTEEEFKNEPLVLKGRMANQETARYHYYDSDGKLIGVRVRLDPPNASKQIKPFIYKLRSDNSENESGWECAELPFSTMPLYNLPELYEFPEKEVLFVEGEKTAEAAKKIFPHMVVITGWGASGNYDRLDLNPLIGRSIVIWSDNDNAGFKGQQTLVSMLENLNTTVRVVSYPDGFPEKWDLADPIPSGYTELDIRAMLDTAPDARGLEAICKNLVFLVGQDRYYDLDLKASITDSVIDKVYGRYVDKISKHIKSQRAIKIVKDTTYVPYEPTYSIVKGDDKSDDRLNVYNPNIQEPLHEEPKAFLTLLDLMFRNQKYREDFVYFLAHCCQKPGRKLNWSTILIGPNGIGKSYFGKFMAFIFGNDARAVPASSLSETVYLGSLLKEAHFLCFDELESNEDKNAVTLKLKNWADAKRLEIHCKGENPYFVPNVLNFMITSNHEIPLNFDKTDRRYFILNFYNMKMPEPFQEKDFTDINVKECYPDLFDTLFSESEMRRIYGYLLKIQIPESFYKMNRAPNTVWKDEILNISRSKVETILNEAISDADPPFDSDFFTTKEVKSFLQEKGTIRQVVTDIMINKALIALGCVNHGQKNLKGSGNSRKMHTIWSSPGICAEDENGEFDIERCQAILKRRNVF